MTWFVGERSDTFDCKPWPPSWMGKPDVLIKNTRLFFARFTARRSLIQLCDVFLFLHSLSVFINTASKLQTLANIIMLLYLIRVFLKTKKRANRRLPISLVKSSEKWKHIFCLRRLLSVNALQFLWMTNRGLFEMKSNNQLGGKNCE